MSRHASESAFKGYRRNTSGVQTDGGCTYRRILSVRTFLWTSRYTYNSGNVCTHKYRLYPQLTEVQTDQLVGTDKWAPPSVRQKRRVQTKYSVLQFSKGFGDSTFPVLFVFICAILFLCASATLFRVFLIEINYFNHR